MYVCIYIYIYISGRIVLQGFTVSRAVLRCGSIHQSLTQVAEVWLRGYEPHLSVTFLPTVISLRLAWAGLPTARPTNTRRS